MAEVRRSESSKGEYVWAIERLTLDEGTVASTKFLTSNMRSGTSVCTKWTGTYAFNARGSLGGIEDNEADVIDFVLFVVALGTSATEDAY